MVKLLLILVSLKTGEERRIYPDPFQTMMPMGCVMQGQMEAQEWLRAHPDFQLTSWKCEPANKPAEKST